MLPFRCLPALALSLLALSLVYRSGEHSNRARGAQASATSDFQTSPTLTKVNEPRTSPVLGHPDRRNHSSLRKVARSSPAPVSLDSLPSDEQTSLWQALSEARREVRPIPLSWNERPENLGYDLYAIHPTQKLRARFGAGSFQLTSSSRTHTDADQKYAHTAWAAYMKLASFAGQVVDSGAAPVKSIELGSRVEYHHTGVLTEWYTIQKNGIEHGFTIAARPAHLDEGDSVELQISLAGLEAVNAHAQDAELVFTSDGDQILTYSGLKVFDAKGLELDARMEATEDGFLLAYHDVGAVYPITVDPLITSQEAELTANDAAASDLFGYSVSVSGDTVAIGARHDDDGGSNSGSVYVFSRRGSLWSQEQKLIGYDTGTGDQFGASVSVSGDTVVVGARFSDGLELGSGSAYVFTRNAGVWRQQQKLAADDALAGDLFGTSVSVSGDTVVVGARHDDGGGSNSGSVYVFSRSGTLWSQKQKLIANDSAAGDQFGASVSVSGDTIAIGASGTDDRFSDTGSVYVFSRRENLWSQQQKLTADDRELSDGLGTSVSVDGDTLVSGAGGDDDGGNRSGSAYVFTRSGSVWSQQQKLTADDAAADDRFGLSVSVSDGTIVVGAYRATDGRTNSGSAYVFARNDSVWNLLQKLSADDGEPGDSFGYSVSVSGDTVVVGARRDGDGGFHSGSAYVFARSGNLWSQQQRLSADDAMARDEFGVSVSVSGDTLVAGAYRDDDGGLNSGSAYVFTRSESGWNLQQKVTASDATAGDFFGESVSISGDTVVIGAPFDGDAERFSGSGYVFSRRRNVWTQQQKLTPNDPAARDFFGESVSISGDTLVAGARGDDAVGSESGSAYVFTRSGSVWSQQQKLTANDAAADDNFGEAVSVFGDTVVVGAHFDDDRGSNSGSAYVFARSGTVWSQQQKLTPTDAQARDEFGISVSVYGNTVVAGAHGDDDDGIASGSAYIFTRSGTAWTQRQKLTANDAAPQDEFGCSVSISGSTVVVGARGDDEGGGDSGSAYLFSRSANVWRQQQKLSANDAAMEDRFGESVSVSGDTVAIGTRFDDGSRIDSGSVYVFRTAVDLEKALQASDSFGIVLLDGGSASPFAGIALGGRGIFNFEVRNIGTLDLDVQGIALGGADAGEFSLTLPDLSSNSDLRSGESLICSVNFQPSGLQSGVRNASVCIISDATFPELTFGISGLALSSETDTDGDGLNDWAEYRLSPNGFDWEKPQPNLVDQYYEFASLAGLFTKEEAGGITANFTITDVNPNTGTAGLVFGLEQSPDLTEGSFSPIFANPANLSVDEQGRIIYEVEADKGKRFYRAQLK